MVTKTTWEATASKVVEFVRWAVMEINGHKRVVGYNTEDRRCQVSEPITDYSLKHKTAAIGDNRPIKLVGDSGLDKDGVEAWDYWVSTNNMAKKPSTNITHRYE